MKPVSSVLIPFSACGGPGLDVSMQEARLGKSLPELHSVTETKNRKKKEKPITLMLKNETEEPALPVGMDRVREFR